MIKLTEAVQWGGVTYAPGATIPGLSAADEAGFVASNRAEWVGQPATTHVVVPVQAAISPGGGIELYAGGTPVSVGDGSGVAGLVWDSTAAAAGNRAKIQAALDEGGTVLVRGAAGKTLYIDSTLIVGDRTDFVVDGGTLTQTGAVRMSIVRTGNMELLATTPRGIIPLCADDGTAGDYVLRITVSGGGSAKTLRAGVGGSFGAEVSIAGASAKFAVMAPDGRTLYVRTISGQLPGLDGTYDVPVYVTPRAGAKPITFSRVSGVATVTESAHGRLDGDVVTFLGNADLNGTFFISVSDSDTYTITDARADVSGSARAYAQSDISVRFINGARNVSGASGSANGIHTCANQFFAVNRLYVTGTFKVLPGGKYCAFLQACVSVVLERLTFDNTISDGFTQVGPMDRVTVRHARGDCHDNMFGMGTSNSDNILFIAPGEAGTRDFLSTDIFDVQSDGANQELFRLFGSDGAKHGTITIRRVRGRSAATVNKFLWAFYGDMTLAANSGIVDRIEISDVRWSTPVGSLYQAIKVAGESLAVKCIDIRDVEMSWDSAGATLPNAPCFVSIQGATVGAINIEKSKFAGSATGTLTKLINVESSAPVPGSIVIRECEFTQIENLYKTYTLSAASNALFSVRDCRLTMCAYIVSPAAITGTQQFDFSNIASTGLIALLISGASGGNFTVTGSGLDLCNGRKVNYTGTGATVRVKSLEVEADVTKLARTNGSACYNTNTAAGTLGAAGVVMCDASNAAGSWKLMTDPSKSY